MDFGLSQDQREIQRTARELLATRASPERVRKHAEEGRPDEALWRELAELGWLGIAIAEEHGGQGLGGVELSILCEELGRAIAPVPFLPAVLAATLIEHGGSEEQRRRLLPKLASGENGAAVGVVKDGVAELVVGGGETHWLVLLEEANRQDDSAATTGESERVSGSDRPGAPSRAHFTSARVLAAGEADIALTPSIDPTRSSATVTAPNGAGEPLEADRPGDLQAGLDRALVAIASELVGVCGRALEMTVAYVKERRQFGVPVGSYQAVSHRCAEMLLETEKARSATAFAAWAADADPERLPEAAAMAKAAASQAGVRVTSSAIQAHGGIGFTWEADVHWLFKRAHVNAALLGGGKLHRGRLARILAARTAPALPV